MFKRVVEFPNGDTSAKFTHVDEGCRLPRHSTGCSGLGCRCIRHPTLLYASRVVFLVLFVLRGTSGCHATRLVQPGSVLRSASARLVPSRGAGAVHYSTGDNLRVCFPSLDRSILKVLFSVVRSTDSSRGWLDRSFLGVLFMPTARLILPDDGCFPSLDRSILGVLFMPSAQLVLPGSGYFPSLDRSFLGVLFIPSARLILPGDGCFPSLDRSIQVVLFMPSARLILPGGGCLPSLHRSILGVLFMPSARLTLQGGGCFPGPSWGCSSCCPLNWFFQGVVTFPHSTDPSWGVLFIPSARLILPGGGLVSLTRQILPGGALHGVRSTDSSREWLLSLTRQFHPGGALHADRSTDSSR